VNGKSEEFKLKNFKLMEMRVIDANLCNDEETMANKIWEENSNREKNHDEDEIWDRENGN
jgi:hypothetical protein